MSKKNNNNKEKKPRIKLICGFPLRIEKAIHYDVLAWCFGRISINKFYNEAIRYACNSEGFMRDMEMKYQRNQQQGHFTYVQDTNTLRPGRYIE